MMTTTNSEPNVRITRYFHEAMFGLYVGFFVVSLVFLAAPRLSIPFVHLEVSINNGLHFKQTDLIRGYFEYLVPSAILALCIAGALHAFYQKPTVQEILRSVSGVMLIFAPPTFWFCYYQIIGWPFRWPYRWAPLELAAAGICLTQY